MKIRYRVPFPSADIKAFAMVPRHALPARVVKGLAILFVLSCVALAFVPWQQTAYGEGQVIAYLPDDRPQPIEAPLGGRLEEWHVREGSRVQKGDPIVRIVDVDPELLNRLTAEREAMQAQIAAADTAADTAARDVPRQAHLYKLGLSSRKQLEQAKIAEAKARQEVAKLRASLISVERRIAQQDVQLVTAPRGGIIARRSSGQGTVLVKQGDELALIVPLHISPAVELWIDGNDLPLVAEGDTVRLQFEGWPALQMSGWPSVAVGTFGARVDVIDPAGLSRAGSFRILVRQGPDHDWPAQPLIRQGVRAHGWVLLRQVPLAFELWRRFNDFPPSRAMEKGGAPAWKTEKPNKL